MIIESLNRFLERLSPQFPDTRYQTRSQFMVLEIIFTMAIICGVAIVHLVQGFQHPEQFPLDRILVYPIILAFSLGLLYLNRKGSVLWAGRLLLFGMVLSISMGIPFELQNSLFLLYAFPTILASFLLGPSQSIILFIFSVFSYSLTWYLTDETQPYNYLSILALFWASLAAWYLSDRFEKETAKAASILKRHSVLLEQSPACVYIDEGNESREITYVSPQIRSLLNFEPEDFIAPKNIWENQMHPDDRAQILQVERQQRSLGSAFHAEYRMLTKDNRLIWVRDESSLVKGEGYPRRHGILLDITEQKRSEDLQDAIYQIAQASLQTDDLDTLFHSIHHILSRLMPAENFFIALYDKVTDLISFPYFVDQHDERPEPFHPVKGMTARVLRTGQPYLMTPEDIADLVQKGALQDVGTPSMDWMGVPLKEKDEVIGVLAVQSYSGNIRYSKKDLDVFTFVSTQIAMVISRKRSNMSLQETNQVLQSIVQAAPLPIIALNQDDTIMMWSPAAERVFGWKAEEIIGKEPLYIPVNQRKSFNELWNKIKQGSEIQREEIVRVTKDGSLINLVIYTAPMIDTAGNVFGGMAVMEDVTELKKTEGALRTSEQLYHSTVDSLDEWIYVIDREGKIILANEQAKEGLKNTAPEVEVLGKNLQDIYSHHSKVLFNRYSEVLQNGTRRVDVETMRIGDRNITMQNKIVPVIENGMVERIITVMRDITAEREAEQKIRDSLQEKEILLREIHHRVKNNLQVMVSLLALQANTIQDQRILEIFRETQARVRSMALIHEELYQSRDLSMIQFKPYVQKLVNHLQNAFGFETRVNLVIEAEDDLSLDIDTAIPCGLIVNELVSNAYKYAFTGRKDGEIVISMKKQETESTNWFALMVCDNGIGFPQDIDFRNTESLGLQLVNILARQIGGKLDLQLNHGTAFIIDFPGKKK